jgi:sec-independent protein translocase protein TatB
MFDLGWSELLIVGVAALIVVGPKDLPRMLRTLGQYAGKARSIAREFQRSMDEAARQADIEELKDLRKGLDDMREAQYKIQREMGASILDSPEPAKADKAAEAQEAAGDEAPEPETKPAPKADAKADTDAAATATKPQAEPDNVSGA